MSDDNVRHEERPIMKKAIALLVAAMLLTGLSACGGSTTADAPAKSDGTSKTETNKEEPKPQPADLTGTWKQTNSNDPSSYMEATISGDTIEVNWIGTDTKSLYWKGTYQAPAAAGDWKWTSQGDTETMASALLASQDATKDFTYSEGGRRELGDHRARYHHHRQDGQAINPVSGGSSPKHETAPVTLRAPGRFCSWIRVI